MTNKIWVGSENNYGCDYRIDDNELIIIYDTCYSSYELDNEGIYWNLVSEDNSLNELIDKIEISQNDLLELANIDITQNWLNLSDDDLKNAVIKTYSALWENQVNNPYKDINLELLENFKNAKYFDFNFANGLLIVKFSRFNLV